MGGAEPLDSLIRSTDAAGIVTGALGVVTLLLSLEPLRWGAGFDRRASDHERMAELVDRFYSRARVSWLSLYRHTEALALREAQGGHAVRRLAARVLLVEAMAPRQRSLGCASARAWAAALGELGRMATLTERRLPLRPFLATYHLSVIREGALAEPFLAWALLADDPTPGMSLEDDVPWALALLDIARTYNSVAAQQREPVTFAASSAERPLGVIQDAPKAWALPVYDVRDRLSPRFRLWPWRYRTYRARRRIRRSVAVAAALMAQRRRQRP